MSNPTPLEPQQSPISPGQGASLSCRPGYPGVAARKQTYRLYVDEFGDHTTAGEESDLGNRYLDLVGVWFEDYAAFRVALEGLKRTHLPNYDPDDPPVVHRKDVLHTRGAFRRLHDPKRRMAFDSDLVKIIRETPFPGSRGGDR